MAKCLPNRNVSPQSEGLRGRAYTHPETLSRTLSATSAGVVGQQGVNLPERDLSLEDMGQRGREQMEVDATKREPDPLVKGGATSHASMSLSIYQHAEKRWFPFYCANAEATSKCASYNEN